MTTEQQTTTIDVMEYLLTDGARMECLLTDGALTVPAAVKFSSVSRAELHRRMESGQLAYTKVGRRRLIPRRALIEMLARRLQPIRTNP